MTEVSLDGLAQTEQFALSTLSLSEATKVKIPVQPNTVGRGTFIYTNSLERARANRLGRTRLSSEVRALVPL